MKDDDAEWHRGAWDPDHPWIRENHDYPDYDPDGELDRWLVRLIWVAIVLALWKILDLAWWALSALMSAFKS